MRAHFCRIFSSSQIPHFQKQFFSWQSHGPKCAYGFFVIHRSFLRYLFQSCFQASYKKGLIVFKLCHFSRRLALPISLSSYVTCCSYPCDTHTSNWESLIYTPQSPFSEMSKSYQIIAKKCIHISFPITISSDPKFPHESSRFNTSSTFCE